MSETPNETQSARDYLSRLGTAPQMEKPANDLTPVEAARMGVAEAIKDAETAGIIPKVKLPEAPNKIIEALAKREASKDTLSEIQAAIVSRQAADAMETEINGAARAAIEGGSGSAAPKPQETVAMPVPEDGVVWGEEKIIDIPKPSAPVPFNPAAAPGAGITWMKQPEQQQQSNATGGIEADVVAEMPMELPKEAELPEAVLPQHVSDQIESDMAAHVAEIDAAASVSASVLPEHIADQIDTDMSAVVADIDARRAPGPVIEPTPIVEAPELEEAIAKGRTPVVPEPKVYHAPKVLAPEVVLPPEDIRPHGAIAERAAPVPATVAEVMPEPMSEEIPVPEELVASNDNEAIGEIETSDELDDSEKGASIERNPLFAKLSPETQKRLKKIYATEPTTLGARLEWRIKHMTEIVDTLQLEQPPTKQEEIPRDPMARRKWLQEELARLDAAESAEKEHVSAARKALMSLTKELIERMDKALLSQ